MDDEEDDEEAGGISIEGGYEKDGKYAKIKWENDNVDDEMDVEEDDEEAGGISIEGGYEKDGKYARIKWENDDVDDEEAGWDDFHKPSHVGPQRPTGESISNWLEFRL